MSIEQISPTIVTSTPAHMNPQVKADQATAPPQASQDAEKAIKAIKSDTVTISSQALQKLASDGDTADQEAKESVATKTSEVLKGKK